MAPCSKKLQVTDTRKQTVLHFVAVSEQRRSIFIFARKYLGTGYSLNYIIPETPTVTYLDKYFAIQILTILFPYSPPLRTKSYETELIRRINIINV